MPEFEIECPQSNDDSEKGDLQNWQQQPEQESFQENLESDCLEPSNKSPQEELEQTQKLLQEFEEKAAEFSKMTPDFSKAVEFLAKKRHQQLQSYGVVDQRFYDLQERNQQLEKEAEQLIKIAAQTGRNPAQLFYEVALSYGYGATQHYREAEQKQTAAKSLTSLPGYRSHQPMDIDALAQMPQSDFDKWYWDNQSEFRRIMGG